jgi:SAM-dependent methyltransferase
MSEPDQYFLGYRTAEQLRLQRQAERMAEDSARLFDRIGVTTGQSVVDIGCGPQGCLDLLADRVGPRGSVIGVEPSEEAAALARRFVVDRGFTHVEVRHGDGRGTGLRRAAFDAVVARLVLVNVPEPEQIVREAVALARPGGVVAFHEAVWPLQTYDPPLAAWDRLHEVLLQYAKLNGIDVFIGRRLPRLLRDAGLREVQADVLAHSFPLGHPGRTVALDFVENLADRIVEQGLVDRNELAELKVLLKRHIEDPDTFAISPLFVQAWGRRSS